MIKMAKKKRTKKCKGTGKAKDFEGCGVELPYTEKKGIRIYNAKFGLGIDCKCYSTWLLSTKEGKEVLNAAKISGKKKVKKEEKRKQFKERTARRSLTKDWSKELQTVINKIVRHIDNGLPCLARKVSGQMHAGHVYARGGNSTIKYNLHNIHRQSAHSNHFQNDDGKLREGIVEEYGQEYMDFISELRRTPQLHFNNKEYRDLTEKARGIFNRMKSERRAYTKSERIEMRNRVNIELGIYHREYCEFEL